MKSKRILIIEDDAAFANYLRECLVGAEIFIVESLKDAMVHLEANHFDLIICDLLIPDWTRDPEAMLAYVSMRAKGAVVAAVTGRVKELPHKCCNAAEHKINLGNIDSLLDFIRRAERNARHEPAPSRPVAALQRWMECGRPTHAALHPSSA